MGGEGGVRRDALTNVKSLMYHTDKNNMPPDLRNLGRGGRGMHIKILSLIYNVSGLRETRNLSPFFFFVKWLYSILGLLPIQ